MKPKQKPCDCERLHFPHRKDARCEAYEEEGDDIEKELADDRFNAEFRRVFT
jgi:hypothetical protein